MNVQQYSFWSIISIRIFTLKRDYEIKQMNDFFSKSSVYTPIIGIFQHWQIVLIRIVIFCWYLSVFSALLSHLVIVNKLHTVLATKLLGLWWLESPIANKLKTGKFQLASHLIWWNPIFCLGQRPTIKFKMARKTQYALALCWRVYREIGCLLNQNQTKQMNKIQLKKYKAR